MIELAVVIKAFTNNLLLIWNDLGLIWINLRYIYEIISIE